MSMEGIDDEDSEDDNTSQTAEEEIDYTVQCSNCCRRNHPFHSNDSNYIIDFLDIPKHSITRGGRKF
jgi:hypothetical protein